MSILDKVKSDTLKAAALSAALAFLKNLGDAALRELSLGIEEYFKERRTPDGWTKEEYLSYAIGRLSALKDEDMRPFFLNSLFDYVVQLLINELREKLANQQSETYEVGSS